MASRLALVAAGVAPAVTESVLAWERAEPTTEEVPWDALIARHGRRVVVSLLARGIQLERAKELAQDAWMRVIQNHRAGKLAELKIPGVVITQAIYFARDEHRRQFRRGTAVPASAETGSDRDLEQQVVARAQLRQIVALVGRQSSSAQHVFRRMFGNEQCTAAQVAEEIGISVQRVRQIACELRKRIRRELDGGRHA